MGLRRLPPVRGGGGHGTAAFGGGHFPAGALGLLLHSTLLETGHIRPGMFCFYTNLSNLLVLVYELALAAAPRGGCGSC